LKSLKNTKRRRKRKRSRGEY